MPFNGLGNERSGDAIQAAEALGSKQSHLDRHLDMRRSVPCPAGFECDGLARGAVLVARVELQPLELAVAAGLSEATSGSERITSALA
jgi:hypothetical protein